MEMRRKDTTNPDNFYEARREPPMRNKEFDKQRSWMYDKCVEQGVRFTQKGEIIALDPMTEVYHPMHKNQLKMIIRDWYINAGFSLRGKQLEKFIMKFIEDVALVCETRMKENGSKMQNVPFTNKFLNSGRD
jgi:hypothetical protein